MFLYCVLLILLIYHNASALPLHVTSPTSDFTGVFWDRSGPAVPRTLFSIAWSCLLTTFICAWTSVHPNVPPQSQGRGLLARIKLMFWTIVAPELVLAWAVRQWFAAREIRDTYNATFRGYWLSTRWTMIHGHFLNMGGFKLVNDEIKRIEKPVFPERLHTREDRKRYTEYQCQIDELQFEYGPLTFEHFLLFVEDPNIEFPRITAAEIKDRSKGDGLSKLVVILQTSWFIGQCVARALQGLALSEVELVTLAIASLNAITFAFWWSKPLGVQEPVNVYVPPYLARSGMATEEGHSHHHQVDVGIREDINIFASLGRAVGVIFHPLRYKYRLRLRENVPDPLGFYFVFLPYSLFFVITFPVFGLFPLSASFLLWIIKTEKVEKIEEDETVGMRVNLALRRLRYNLTDAIRQHFGGLNGPLAKICDEEYRCLAFIKNWFFVTPTSAVLLILLLIALSPLFVLLLIASLMFTAIFEIVTTSAVLHGATHVSAFYCPRTQSDRYSRMIVFAIFGVTFGGIHCIGWNFYFPTDSERAMWRYTSLLLTAIPLVAAPIDFVLENLHVEKRFGKKMRTALDIFMTTLLFLYVPARLSLIAQALALLRHQPPSVYDAVDWTKYIPHLFN